MDKTYFYLTLLLISAILFMLTAILTRLQAQIDMLRGQIVANKVDAERAIIHLHDELTASSERVTIIVDSDELNSAHHETGDDLQDALEKMAAFLYDDIGLSTHKLAIAREAMEGLTRELPTATTNYGFTFTLSED